MRRGQRIFLASMLLSLLAHLIAAGSASQWWTAPAPEIPFPIEARLHLAVVPTPASAPAPNPPPASPRSERPAAANPGVQSEPPPAAQTATPDPAPEAMPALFPPAPAPIPATPLEPPAQLPEPAPAQAMPVPEVAAPVAPPRALRNLPERIALRYSVQSGEDGFSIGQTVFSGWIRDGRYSLVSVTEATGITALFVSGKIIQTSEGRVTADGLQPELFWGAKGERRQPSVRFDWAQQRLMLPSGGVALPPQTQDLMSFPFHLAMLVHEGDAEWSLPVTNGKKLREYAFRVTGREQLAIGDTRAETLHLRGERSGEGSLDVWLSPARQWLPVRIRTQDQKGKVIVLTLQDAAS